MTNYLKLHKIDGVWNSATSLFKFINVFRFVVIRPPEILLSWKRDLTTSPLYCGRFTLLDSKVSLVADQDKSIDLFPAVIKLLQIYWISIINQFVLIFFFFLIRALHRVIAFIHQNDVQIDFCQTTSDFFHWAVLKSSDESALESNDGSWVRKKLDFLNNIYFTFGLAINLGEYDTVNTPV